MEISPLYLVVLFQVRKCLVTSLKRSFVAFSKLGRRYRKSWLPVRSVICEACISLICHITSHRYNQISSYASLPLTTTPSATSALTSVTIRFTQSDLRNSTQTMTSGVWMWGFDAMEWDSREGDTKPDPVEWLDGESMMNWKFSKKMMKQEHRRWHCWRMKQGAQADLASMDNGSFIVFYSNDWRGSTGIFCSTVHSMSRRH